MPHPERATDPALGSIDGSGIFTDSTDPNTIVNNLSNGNNIFQWEISNEWKQCKAIIKSGKNAKQRCKCSVNISAHPTDETKWYCGKHKKYIKI